MPTSPRSPTAASRDRGAPASFSPDHDLSSIHMAWHSQAGESDEQEEILDHCWGTARLVSQLATTLKSLEADMDNLRRENRCLRKTVSQVLPLSSETTARSSSPKRSSPDFTSFGTYSTSLTEKLLQFSPQSPLVNLQQSSMDLVGAPSPHFGHSPQFLRSVRSFAQRSGSPLGASSPSSSSAIGPLAASDASESAPSWSVEQTIWLGGAEEEHRFLGGATPVLDPSAADSAEAAVAALNRGVLRCPGSLCIVYCTADRGYRVLYRRACKEQAVALAFGGGFEEALRGIASAATGSAGQPESTMRLQAKTLELPAAPVIVPPNEQSGVDGEQAGLLQQHTGTRVPEDYDAAILDFCLRGNFEKAEALLRRMLNDSFCPSEASFGAVISAACQRDETVKAEELLTLMMELQCRPDKEVFDHIIHVFSTRRDVLKVEEWLLHAGKAGWTPPAEAFETVVMLFAERDGCAAKAEEWLSRVQQTAYRLSNACYDQLIAALLRAGEAKKANDWLLRMVHDQRSPADATLHEAVSSLTSSGDLTTAESWLAVLAQRGSSPSALCTGLFDAMVRAADVDGAERHFAALEEPDAVRTRALVGLLAERGEAARARATLDLFQRRGGKASPDLAAAVASCTSRGPQAAEPVSRLRLPSSTGGGLLSAQTPPIADAGAGRRPLLARALPQREPKATPEAEGKPGRRGGPDRRRPVPRPGFAN